MLQLLVAVARVLNVIHVPSVTKLRYGCNPFYLEQLLHQHHPLLYIYYITEPEERCGEDYLYILSILFYNVLG